jgi:hypothetical protein
MGGQESSPNQTTIPRSWQRDFAGKYITGDVATLVRQADKDHLALDTGGGLIARL